MYSFTKTSQQAPSTENLHFQQKQKIAFKKASSYVANWLAENNKSCNELIFDRNIISYEKDYFKYTIRVVEQYLKRAYCFEMVCRGNRFEISYVKTSQSPLDLVPGDFNLRLYNSW